jgi:hypothetical protein
MATPPVSAQNVVEIAGGKFIESTAVSGPVVAMLPGSSDCVWLEK